MSATTRIGLQRTLGASSSARIHLGPTWTHLARIRSGPSQLQRSRYATATANATATAGPSGAGARRKASGASTGSAKDKAASGTGDANSDQLMKEAMKRLEQMSQRSVPAHMDIWSQPLQLQDVHVPSRLSTLPKGLGWNARLSWLKQNVTNYFYNAVALFRLANSKGGIPGHSIPTPYTFKIFSTSSTKPKTWLTPLRHLTLERYKLLNESFASGNISTLRQITIEPLQGEYRKRLKNRESGGTGAGALRYVWKFHGEASPTRCVSLRANEGYVSSTPPKTGNTLFVHAVMRFDTMQSLTVYRKNGQLIQGDPEKPKRVVEYMVFEKRMWYDEPWVLRDQVFEGVAPKVEG